MALRLNTYRVYLAFRITMITACTVSKGHDQYIHYLTKSIARNAPLVEKIIIASYSDPVAKSWTVGNLHCEQFPIAMGEAGKLYQHPYALQMCIEKVDTDLVWCTDPDVLFAPGIDYIYLQLHRLYNFVGCAHHNATCQAFDFFPTVINLLFSKSDIPDQDFVIKYIGKDNMLLSDSLLAEQRIVPSWLRNEALKKMVIPVEFPLQKFYLVPGYTTMYHDYPNIENPNALFDIGTLLYQWCYDTGRTWASFRTIDCFRYMSQYVITSDRTKVKMDDQLIIFHQSDSTRTGIDGLYKKHLTELDLL